MVVVVYMQERSLVVVVLEDRVWPDSGIELLVQEGKGLLARPWPFAPGQLSFGDTRGGTPCLLSQLWLSRRY